MDAAGLIASLVELERAALKCGEIVIRDFVIEAQDWILRTQKENLELRRENHVLRLRHESLQSEAVQPRPDYAAVPPLIFYAIAQSNRRRERENPNEAGSQPDVQFARAG